MPSIRARLAIRRFAKETPDTYLKAAAQNPRLSCISAWGMAMSTQCDPIEIASERSEQQSTWTPGVLLALAIVYLVWSTTYLAIHYLVATAPPLLSAGLRYLLAGFILFAWQRLRGARLPNRQQWLAALWVGLLLFGGGNGCVVLAQRTVSSGIAAMVVAMTPIAMGLVSLAFGSRPGRREWLGIGIGFLGVAMLSFDKELSAAWLPLVLLLLAPISWALGSVWSVRLPAPSGAMAAALQMLCGGSWMLAIGFLRGETVPSSLSNQAVWAFVYLLVFGSLLGFTAYGYLLVHTRPAVAMSYAYVNPVLAVLLGVVIADEHLSLIRIAAAPLILIGVAFMLRAKAKPS